MPVVVRLAGADCTVRLLESEEREDLVFRGGRFLACGRCFRLPVLMRAAASGGLGVSTAVGSGVGPNLRALLLSEALLGCLGLLVALFVAAAVAETAATGDGGTTAFTISEAGLPFC